MREHSVTVNVGIPSLTTNTNNNNEKIAASLPNPSAQNNNNNSNMTSAAANKGLPTTSASSIPIIKTNDIAQFLLNNNNSNTLYLFIDTRPSTSYTVCSLVPEISINANIPFIWYNRLRKRNTIIALPTGPTNTNAATTGTNNPLDNFDFEKCVSSFGGHKDRLVAFENKIIETLKNNNIIITDIRYFVIHENVEALEEEESGNDDADPNSNLALWKRLIERGASLHTQKMLAKLSSASVSVDNIKMGWYFVNEGFDEFQQLLSEHEALRNLFIASDQQTLQQTIDPFANNNPADVASTSSTATVLTPESGGSGNGPTSSGSSGSDRALANRLRLSLVSTGPLYIPSSGPSTNANNSGQNSSIASTANSDTSLPASLQLHRMSIRNPSAVPKFSRLSISTTNSANNSATNSLAGTPEIALSLPRHPISQSIAASPADAMSLASTNHTTTNSNTTSPQRQQLIFTNQTSRFASPTSPSQVSPTTLEPIPPYTQIRPYLYVGSEEIFTTQDPLGILHSLGVTHVLNMATECDYPIVEKSGVLKYMKYGTRDNASENVDEAIMTALAFIEEARRQPASKIFVHCKAGKSRSVTIVLAHLIKTEKIHLNEAYEDVRSKRGVIEPNLAFMGTLLLIEREVFGEGNTSTIGEPVVKRSH